MSNASDDLRVANNTWLARPDVSGAEYDAPYQARAAAGEDVHGEASAVLALHPGRPFRVLDAGCGTGRIAIELARQGVDVVGVDLDARMLDQARAKAPALDWRLDDLATCDLGRAFDLILLAGNVLLFVTPGTEAQVLRNMVRHLVPQGLLVAGFQLGRTAFDIAQYDVAAAAAGVVLCDRCATWQGDSWTPDSAYAVSLHRLSAVPAPPTPDRK
ncbi:MAG: class I SAM-dependent methyltransferase [Herpetosiphon sp.]